MLQKKDVIMKDWYWWGVVATFKGVILVLKHAVFDFIALTIVI